MPAPAVYVVGVTVVIAGAATVYVVKHHVWDPHVSPKLKTWANDFKIRVNARKMRRRGPPIAVVSPSTRGSMISKKDKDSPPVIPLKDLAASPIATGVESTGTLQSRNPHALDEPNATIAFETLQPSDPNSRSSTPVSPFVIHDDAPDPFQSPPSNTSSQRAASPMPSSPSTISMSSLEGSQSFTDAHSVPGLQVDHANHDPFLMPEADIRSPTTPDSQNHHSDVASSFQFSDFEHVGSDAGVGGDWTPVHGHQ